MRIAFASCFSATLHPNQPVWSWIQAKNPDHLVLLGDSIYLDLPKQGDHPKDLSDNDFAQRLFDFYQAQLKHPLFADLVKSLGKGRVWSIWDDHDFLWNNANGADESQSVVQGSKVKLSTAFQDAFRRAIGSGLAAGSFPTAYNDPVFWNPHQPALSTPSVQLAPDVWLHLTDGRTHRTSTDWRTSSEDRTLLGEQQRETLGARLSQAPNALHLIASGSTLGSYKKSYPTDWQWLIDKAANVRTLVLSGDIHKNDRDYFPTSHFPLHEVTSSGAALASLVALGKPLRNYGLIDIEANQVKVRFYAHDEIESPLSTDIQRSTWARV